MPNPCFIIVQGTDHAGIATQLQVEKALISEGTTREEVGREPNGEQAQESYSVSTTE